MIFARRALRFLACAAVLWALARPAYCQLTISPGTLPTGITGEAYSALVSANSNEVPDTFTISAGSLPPGLTIVNSGQSFATIQGTPTAAGTYTFTVLATENIPTALITGSQSYTVQIAAQLVIASNSLTPATVEQPYVEQLVANGGTPPYTWSLYTYMANARGLSPGRPARLFARAGAKASAEVSVGLPPGLSLGTTGLITGSPTQAGTFSFDVLVSDSSSTIPQSTTSTIFITVEPASPLIVSTTSPLPGGTVGLKYSIPLRAQGGNVPYTWTLTSGTLPPGLQISSAGSLTGTPTQAGTYTFTLTVTDVVGNTANMMYTLTIAAGFAITTASLPPGAVGVAYSQLVNVTPTTGPYEFSVTSGALPGGLTLTASSATPASMLIGTPTAAGSFPFTITATDSAGHSASQAYTLVIAAPPITITPANLPNGTLGTKYSQTLTATGGAGGYVFSISSGAAPGGITLTSAGALSGTPTASGTFSFSVTVTDSKQTTVTQAYQLTIVAPTAPPATVTGVGTTVQPAQQPTISVQISGPYPTDLTGTITLTFVSATGNVDDPAIQFSTGGRTVTFTIPAGQTTAVFPSATLSLGTGTVAGTITLTLDLKAGNVDVTPQPAPTQTITISLAAPVITNVTVSTTSGGIEVDVTGFSNTRDMVSATFTFQAASGTTLQGGTQTISVGSLFSTWYSSSASDQYGSQFTFEQSFNINGSGVTSVSVTLTNSQGTSTAMSASVP